MDVITLAAGDRVRLASWAYPYDRTTVEVGTVRAYSARYHEDPEAAHQRALRLGHRTVWTLYGGSVLLGDPAAREAQARQQDEEMARAVTLEPGQEVRIEGEAFVVKVVPGNVKAPRNSDPIHFIPSK
jgi:hypothetical protein